MKMADDGIRLGGLSSGLAVILNGEDGKENLSKNRLVSYCDDFGNQPVERALEYIFDLPNKSLGQLAGPVDKNLVRHIIKNDFMKFHGNSNCLANDRKGIHISDNSCLSRKVGLQKSCIWGDYRTIRPPLFLESLTMFCSMRGNVCVWKGKWMYEVTLDTCGVMQLGWATMSCLFTDHMGVGDADNSYAFDGKRVKKWNKQAEAYGQSWVSGDVIGCCINLDDDEILFYRNGISLGVAFHGVHKMGPKCGYYPAISVSQGERCELNFGAKPFRYPIEGFLPLEEPPSVSLLASQLLRCLSRFLDIQCLERADSSIVGKLRRLKRFISVEELSDPVCHGICEKLFHLLEEDAGSKEYIVLGPLMSFIMEFFRVQPPHDYTSLDRFIDVFLEFEESKLLFECLIRGLSHACKTTSLILTECPYSGSYSYLSLACHIFARKELMVLWWKLEDFDLLFEGFLSQKSPSKQDLHYLLPSVWWPGSCEDVTYESSMWLTTTALSEAVSKVEEKQRDLCLLVIQFIPPTEPPQLPGSVFRTFLQNLLLKNRGADRNMPPPGVSSNSVLVSLFTVILHFLSEGFSMINNCKTNDHDVGFLHRGGEQSFPVDLFVKDDYYRTDVSRLGGSFSHISKSHPVCDQESEVIQWEEGCMDDEETRVTHKTTQKPCCCSSFDTDFSKISKHHTRYPAKGSRNHCAPIPERPAHVVAECSASSLNDEIEDKPSTSDRSEPEFGYRPLRDMWIVPRESNISSATLREEELLDTLLLLYHIGVAPNFKQASYYMSHQSQSMSLLEETDKQIRESGCSEQVRRLKEVRNNYREEVIDCVRHCSWYRISLFSRWKQRGMYATCMWIVQLLLVLTRVDSLFIYIPEFYLETLVDCFHVLRKSDPPFVPSAIFLKQGLTSFVTFVVTHFNDPRILSADLKDLLLQSISALVQDKDYLVALESNEAAIQRLPKALLSAFDNRSWILVSNTLLRLCRGKQGESSSSSSIFQDLLREACISDGELLSAFLNRLFNILSWTMTEFSVSIREMQEKYQVVEFQRRKCCFIFTVSCNLTCLLEFFTHEIPQAFLSGTDTNLRRLTELVVFVLNNITSAADAEFFDLSLRRNSQSSEKVNRSLILFPLLGVILNLLDGSRDSRCEYQNDIVTIFASMDCPDTIHRGFQYLLDYNWAGLLRGDPLAAKLGQLEDFLSLLISRIEWLESEKMRCKGERDNNDDETTCCICCINETDTKFVPCSHRSCYGCITRHLLNCHRCFFCNATVLDITKIGDKMT